MQIAILNYHRLGGSGIVAYEIGRAMAENRGHEVHFIGLEPPFRLQDNLSNRMHFHRIALHDYPVFNYPPYTLALASQLGDLIDQYNIEVVHSHYALPHAVAAILARDIAGRRVRCVTTLHGTDITVVGAHPTMKNITRYAIQHSDAVTAVSRDLKSRTVTMFGIDPDRIDVVYNFVNPEVFHPGLRPTERNRPEAPFVVLHMSNLRPVKQPLDVIRIFHGLVNHAPASMALWVLGEGPMQPEMIRLARDLGIADRVRFLGERNPVGPIVASADLMLLPSREEAFGLSALEAMACGVPVLAAAAGGLPEVVRDSETGFLFPPGDMNTAIRLGTELLTNDELRRRMGESARKDALHRFNMADIVQQYESIYQHA